MKPSKIFFFSSNRADLGIIEPVFQTFLKTRTSASRLVITGQLHSNKALIKDLQAKYPGCHLTMRIPIESTKVSQIVDGFAESVKKAQSLFSKHKPDAIMIVGDRFEIFGVVIAAYLSRIKIIHLHGGELTFGALDDGFRHSISKMADLHFTAAEAYRRRLIQMGEQPGSVYVSGAPALEHLYALKNKGLSSDFSARWPKYIVATLHPETRSDLSPAQQASRLLKALDRYKGGILFTAANNDLGGREVNRSIQNWVKKNPQRGLLMDALGSENYWKALSGAEFMIGNSSSGILESALLGVPAVNIGDRQKGRIRSANVIDTKFDSDAIIKGIDLAESARRRKLSRNATSPFFNPKRPRPSELIMKKTLAFLRQNPASQKEFFDLDKVSF